MLDRAGAWCGVLGRTDARIPRARRMPIRDANIDVWVRVTSISDPGARARVKLYIFDFFSMVMHHTIQKKIKSDLGEFGCARGPQSPNYCLILYCIVLYIGPPRDRPCHATLGYTSSTNSGARARGLSFIFYFVLHGMLQKSIPCRKK